MSESLGELEPVLEEMGREKSLSVQESLSEISESDVAKFPALFGVRQIIKSDPLEARQQLVEVRIGSNDLRSFVYVCILQGSGVFLLIADAQEQGKELFMHFF